MPRAGPNGLPAPNRGAVVTGEFERGVHTFPAPGTAWIDHLELPTERRVARATTIINIIGAGPETAGMVVADIAVPRTVHIGPGLRRPVRRDLLAMAIPPSSGWRRAGRPRVPLRCAAHPNRQLPGRNATRRRWTPGQRAMLARRARMMCESSAFRASASGNCTAATGVANRPRMLISMRVMFVLTRPRV